MSQPDHLPLLRAARIVGVGKFFASERNFSVIGFGASGFEPVEQKPEFVGVGVDLLSGLVLDSDASEIEDRSDSEVVCYNRPVILLTQGHFWQDPRKAS